MRFLTYSILLLMLILASCSSVPVTGRKQMLLVSDSEVLTLSLQEYDQFMKTASKSTNYKSIALVQKVGRNIANAVERYLNENGLSSMVSDFSWEFNLVKSTDVNAFCMPGGKIVVYEGILPITNDEVGLAVVLGHEVAHAVAKHANERVSQQMLTQYGGQALTVVMGSSSSQAKMIASTAFGLGTQYGITLPFSRKQELEADRLGLIFMSMAGYDPTQAPSFWERMSAAGGSKVPEFQSTHPSDATRIKRINEVLPEALKYYKRSFSNTTTGAAKTSTKWSF